MGTVDVDDHEVDYNVDDNEVDDNVHYNDIDDNVVDIDQNVRHCLC